MRFLSVVVLNLCLLSFAGTAHTQSPPSQAQSVQTLPPLETKIAKVVRKHFPEAEIQSKNGVFQAKHGTMEFTVHGRTLTGQILEKTYQVEGPNYRGFMISVSTAEGNYHGMAAIPQTLDDVYWSTFIDRPPTEDDKGHYVINFSYGSRLDKEFQKEVFELLPSSLNSTAVK